MTDKARRTAVKRHMRSNAMEFISADATDNWMLDLETFGVMVKARLRRPDLDADVIATWFDVVDVANNGSISFEEWFVFSMFDVSIGLNCGVDILLKDYDKDDSGSLSRGEWRKAMEEMGFEHVADTLFAQFDLDNSGRVGYFEVVESARVDRGDKPGQLALVEALARVEAGAPDVALATSDESSRLASADSASEVQRHLEALLKKSKARVLDLFKEWDDDGSGLITEAEFVRGLVELGFTGSKAAAQLVFDSLDESANFTVSFAELDAWLNDSAEVDAAAKAEAAAAAASKAEEETKAASKGGDMPAVLNLQPTRPATASSARSISPRVRAAWNPAGRRPSWAHGLDVACAREQARERARTEAKEVSMISAQKAQRAHALLAGMPTSPPPSTNSSRPGSSRRANAKPANSSRPTSAATTPVRLHTPRAKFSAKWVCELRELPRVREEMLRAGAKGSAAGEQTPYELPSVYISRKLKWPPRGFQLLPEVLAPADRAGSNRVLVR